MVNQKQGGFHTVTNTAAQIRSKNTTSESAVSADTLQDSNCKLHVSLLLLNNIKHARGNEKILEEAEPVVDIP